MMKQIKLSREVGVILLLFYGIGNILGAGIYVLVGKVAGISGNFTLFAFLLACIIVLFTALSYMELAARYPISAGVAVYVQEGIGYQKLSVVMGSLIATAGMVSAAAITHGFAGYLNQLIPVNEELSIVILIFALVCISIVGIKMSVVVATVLTLIEMLGLLIIIYYGFDRIINPTLSFQALIPSFNFSEISVVFFGAFLAFYAFLGFEDMVNIAEEVKEPQRTFPLAIFLALVITTSLYILVVLVALETLSLDELRNSQAPFADIYQRLTGKDPIVISMIGSFAVVNGALIQIVMASRIIYGMAKKGWLPRGLKQVSGRTKTPIEATIFVGLMTMAFALSFDIIPLAGFTSTLILIVFTFVNIALIRIKRTRPLPEKVIKIPIWIPWCGAFFNLTLLGMQLFSGGE